MREVIGGLFVILWLFLIGNAVFGGLFVDPNRPISTLRTFGFSDIKITDHSWAFVQFRGCGVGDNARFTASATNSRGEKVWVYVCTASLFKGSTVRTD